MLWFFSFLLLFVVCLAVLYSSLLKPIFISCLLAYVFLPVVRRFEKKGFSSKMAALVVVTLAVIVSLLCISRLIPISYNKGLQLLSFAPAAASSFENHWIPLLQEFADSFGVGDSFDLQASFENINVLEELRQQFQRGFLGLWTTGTSFLGGVLNVALIPLITFFIIVERLRIYSSLRSFVPLDWTLAIDDIATNIDVTLRNVVKGQVTVAGILMILYVIGFGLVNILFGLQSAITIAVIAGACRIIPYLDILVGALLSSVIILSDFQNWGQVFGVIAVISVVQLIDGMYITPRVIGEKVGLHPIIVILSLLAFGDWFGIWGILIAIPSVAVAKIILSALIPIYTSSRVFGKN